MRHSTHAQAAASKSGIVLALLVAVQVAAACAADTSVDQSGAPEVAVPEPDEASGDSDIFTVTFDASGCTVSGRPEVPAGLHFFILKNSSDVLPGMVLVKPLDGNTAQDLLDLQSSPGVFFDQPDWVAYANAEPAEAGRFSLDTELAEDERAYAFTLEEGENAIVVGNHLVGWRTLWAGEAPLWVCSALLVT